MEKLFEFIKDSLFNIEGVQQVELINDISEIDTFKNRSFTFCAVQIENDFTIDSNNNTRLYINILLEQSIDAEKKIKLKQLDILKKQLRELKFILSKSNKYAFAKEYSVIKNDYETAILSTLLVARFEVVILEGNFCPI